MKHSKEINSIYYRKTNTNNIVDTVLFFVIGMAVVIGVLACS